MAILGSIDISIVVSSLCCPRRMACDLIGFRFNPKLEDQLKMAKRSVLSFVTQSLRESEVNVSRFGDRQHRDDIDSTLEQ